uniref:Uncharacterized protein n=1 Tax=Lepeophtheirus salmonis TaxID=72036 RepID=A0A0K2SX00_LEPSM
MDLKAIQLKDLIIEGRTNILPQNTNRKKTRHKSPSVSFLEELCHLFYDERQFLKNELTPSVGVQVVCLINLFIIQELF